MSVPIPVICKTSPTFVLIPTVVNVAAAPMLGLPMTVGSNSNFSVPLYPDPPSMTSNLIIDPPDMVTFAVAPSHVVVPSLNNLILWYVPSVYPVPPVKSVYVTIPLKPCSLSKVIVETPAIDSIPVIFKPLPKSCSNLSVASLVILFLRLLVTTSPIGVLRANETAAGGLSFSLSLSCCGYKSVTF